MRTLIELPLKQTVSSVLRCAVLTLVLEGLSGAGLALPSDCSFLTFGDSAWAAAYRPSINTIDGDLYGVAEAMTRALLGQLGVIDVDPARPVEVDRYVVRQSVGTPHRPRA